jgi:hypothetical protein
MNSAVPEVLVFDGISVEPPERLAGRPHSVPKMSFARM